MKICIAAPLKQEELYIKEWLEHLKFIGVDKVILADNNDSNYIHPIKDIIQDYINADFVTLLNYQDKIGIQLDFYNYVYKNFSNDFDWIGFIDTDEFIELPLHKNIHSFLNNINHESVSLRWYNYGDNENLFYENKPVRDRFKTMSKNQLKSFQPTKYFLRTKLNKTITNVNSPPTLDVCDVLNSLNFKVLCKTPHSFNFMFHKDEYLHTAYISHYITKSTEEYIKYKMLRGRVANTKKIRYDKKFYFKYNQYTEEKLNLFKNMFTNLNN